MFNSEGLSDDWPIRLARITTLTNENDSVFRSKLKRCPPF